MGSPLLFVLGLWFWVFFCISWARWMEGAPFTREGRWRGLDGETREAGNTRSISKSRKEGKGRGFLAPFCVVLNQGISPRAICVSDSNDTSWETEKFKHVAFIYLYVSRPRRVLLHLQKAAGNKPGTSASPRVEEYGHRWARLGGSSAVPSAGQEPSRSLSPGSPIGPRSCDQALPSLDVRRELIKKI